MPFDCENPKPEKIPPVFFDERRIYVCEGGNVRIETRHFRRTFSPAEFLALLRPIFRKCERKTPDR